MESVTKRMTVSEAIAGGRTSEGSDTAESTAAALARTLERLGVRHLFGMDSPEALYAELDRGRITPITARDERSAAVMADAYSRVSGRVGVCTGLHGAGATNLVQGVIEAWLASSAVVVLASELSRHTKHKNELQDIDHTPFFSSITKWAARIENPQRVSEMTARGFSLATSGRPRPVYLGYPADVLSNVRAEVPVASVAPAKYPAARVGPDPEALRSAAATLAAARRPAIIAGGGVLASGATAELERFAQVLQAPVATTPLGKGAFDETNERWAGVTGSYTGGQTGRGKIANEVVQQADVVLLVGSKTDSVATADWTVPRPGATVIHIDIDPAEVGRNYPGSIPVVADAKLALEALTSALDNETVRGEWFLEELRPRVLEWEERWSEFDRSPNIRPIAPERIARDLNGLLDDETILTTDASYSSVWAMEFVRFRTPGRRFLAPRGYGALGWGLPAAIGAKLAAPASTVLCLTGDGGFGYVFQELETAARYDLPLVVVVLNNRGLGFQQHYEQRFWSTDGETNFLDVDFALIAQAMRCEGIRIEAAEDFPDAVREAIKSQRPTVIDVIVDLHARPPLTMYET